MKKGVKYFLIVILIISVLGGIMDACSSDEDDASSGDTSSVEVQETKSKKGSKTTYEPKPTKNPAKKIDKILSTYRKNWKQKDAEELKSYDKKSVYAGICRSIKKEYKENQKNIKKINYEKIFKGEGTESSDFYWVNNGYSNLGKLVQLYLDLFPKEHKREELIKIQKLVKTYEKNYEKFVGVEEEYDGIENFVNLLQAYETAEVSDIYVSELLDSTIGAKIEKIIASDKGYYYYCYDAVYDSYFGEYEEGENEFIIRTYDKLPHAGYYALKIWNTGETTPVEYDGDFERDIMIYEVYFEEDYEQLLKEQKSLNKIRKNERKLDGEIKKLVDEI